MADDDKVWVIGLDGPTEEVDESGAPAGGGSGGSGGGSGGGNGGGSRGGRRLDLNMIGAVILGVVLGVGMWAWLFQPEVGPQPIEYEVVSGDSLWRIANSHGVSVTDLKAWNELASDHLEVGQVLEIWPPDAAADVEATSASGRKGRIKGGRIAVTPSPQDPGGLVMPAPKECLSLDEGDLLDGDEPSMIATAGLSYQQTKASMDRSIPNLGRCIEGEGAVVGTVSLEITVGCNGRVQEIRVMDAGGVPPKVVSCVRDTLRYTAFPAHDMRDGFTFAYPLTFEFDG